MNYFFIAGGQRCGSTFLYNLLDSHPSVRMAKPVRPEPKFFLSEEYESKDVEYYLSKYYNQNEKLENLVLGEKSTSYLEYDYVPGRVKNYFPKAKCIIILRNPVDRAISNYFFSCKNGLETRTLDEVFIKNTQPPNLKDKISVSPFDYFNRGLYSKYLVPYLKEFGDNLIVLIFDELISEINEKKKLFSFLGLNYSKTDTKMLPKNNLDYSEFETGSIEKIKDKLTIEYANEIEKLELLIGRNLNLWKR